MAFSFSFIYSADPSFGFFLKKPTCFYCAGVTDEDDGFYTCTLIGVEKNNDTGKDEPAIFDRKVVRLIILSK